MQKNRWVLIVLFILIALVGGQVFAKKTQKSRVQQLIYGTVNKQLSEVDRMNEGEAVKEPAALILPGRVD